MADLQKLSALLNNSCTNYNHKCDGISTAITAFHKNGGQVDSTFLTNFITRFTNNTGYYSCTHRDTTYKWVISLIEILGYLDPGTNDIIELISKFQSSNYSRGGNAYETVLTQLWQVIIKKVKEIPVDIFLQGVKSNNISVLTMIVDYTKTTPECVEAISSLSGKSIQTIVERMFLQKVKITTKALNNALIRNKELANYYLNIGIQPNIESLEKACESRDINLIQMILLCKLTPTDKCFDGLFTGYNSYRSSTDPIIPQIIDMLVVHGYNLTYDNVLKALTYKCKINNIKNYNIKFDGKFIEKCAELGFYPYTKNEIGISPTIECLRIECTRSNNLKAIKQLVANGLKPDIECLKNACRHHSNITVIRYLVEKHNLKTNADCIKAFANTIGNKTLNYIVLYANLSEVQADSEANKLEIKKLGFVDDPELEDLKPESDLELESEPESEDESETKEKKPNQKPKEIQETKEEKYNIFKIEDMKLEIDSRKKYSLCQGVPQLFNMKQSAKNSVTLTYIDIRKLLLTYIVNNKLINNETKNIIKLDTSLSTILKAQKDQYIKFENIDNVVKKFIKI